MGSFSSLYYHRIHLYFRNNLAEEKASGTTTNKREPIIHGFQLATEHNIKAANDQLKALSENMHWDLGFMLKLGSLEFRDLKTTSVSNKKGSNKKNLLFEIEDLLKKYSLKKYSNLPADSNKIELY